MKVIDKTQQYNDAILYGAILGKIMFIIADKVYASISLLIDKDYGEKQDLLTAYFMEVIERKFTQEATLSEYYDDAKRLYGKYQDVIDPKSKKNPSLITGKEALGAMCMNSIKIILEQLKKVSVNSIENTPWHEKWLIESELGITTWVSLNDIEKKQNAGRHSKAFRKNNLTHQPYFNPSSPEDLTDLEKWINNKWGKFAPPHSLVFGKKFGADISYATKKNKLLWQRFIKITPASFDKSAGSIYSKIEDIEKETFGQYTESGPSVFNLWPAFYSYNLRGHVNIDYWEEAWIDFIQNLPTSQVKGSKAALNAARYVYRFPYDMYKKIEYGVRAVYLCDESFFNNHNKAFLAQYDDKVLSSATTSAFRKTYGDSAYLINNKTKYGIWPRFLIPIAEVKKEYNIEDLAIFNNKNPPWPANQSEYNDHQKISWEAEARVKMVRKKLDAELASLQKELLETNEMRALTEYIFPYHLLPQMSAIYCIEALSNALMSLSAGGGIPSVLVNAGLDVLINKIRYSGVYMKNE